ncbi:hypothetical protein GCM10010455_17980 [Microbacterium esteraromaticum]
MKAEPVLDYYSLDQDDPVRFRVHFWERPGPGYAWNLDAWLLSDVASVREAIEWVAENRHGRTYELFVETSGDLSEAYLVRLDGENPNNP